MERYATADRITLTGVECLGYHGVLESEKQNGQPFIVDVTLLTDFSSSASSDDIGKTANYAEVAETIREVVSDGSVDLVETLAEKLAATILSRFAIDALELTVHKPQAPIEVPFADVAVTIFRKKQA
ncbi:dihydroneopterin aldolase [Rothia sp. ZJ932]|nr:dihydroneopterin aldolase [Rothia sp. ZJ1223]QRZ62502.1 dihydroneopterin aldolase [Rothia sp. ZJ932]